MKQLLLIIAVVVLVGCASTSTSWISNPNDHNNVVIEKAIRNLLFLGWKPTGELTKADLDKVKELNFFESKLTDVKGIAGKRHSEPSSNHVTFGSFLCVRLLMKPTRCISREKRLRGRRQIKRVLPNIEAGTTIDSG